MKIPLTVLIVFLATGCSLGAEKTHPKTILVIRHAEKPDDIDDIHLDPAGKKRAGALPELFKKADPFPTPDFIFAANKSKHSNRSVETVTPLAKSLKLEVNDKFEDDEFAKLAQELFKNPKYDGKTVLVCWHHGNIPELLQALGFEPKPKKIDDRVFDRVWVVTFDEKGKLRPLSVRPQALMPTDPKQ